MTDSEATGADRDAAGLGRFMIEHLRMQLSLLLRYKVDFVGRIITSYLLFALVFFGGQTAARRLGQTANLGSGLTGFVVGWFLLAMVQAAYASLSKAITRESRRGTLEQLYISPYGFGRVMLTRVVIQILLSVLAGAMILALMLLTTNQTVDVDVITVVPIVLFTLLSVVGVGLLLAGLTLVYKKVGSLINIVQFAIIGLVGAPLLEVGWLRYLPVAQGSMLLQRAMTGSTAIWEFSAADLSVLFATGLGYFGVGYAVFAYCSRVARARGVMGHY